MDRVVNRHYGDVLDVPGLDASQMGIVRRIIVGDTCTHAESVGTNVLGGFRANVRRSDLVWSSAANTATAEMAIRILVGPGRGRSRVQPSL